MNWTQFKDRFPKEEEVPSGAILVTYSSWTDAKLFYEVWSMNGEEINEKKQFIQDFWWIPIPLMVNQKTFWWK